LLQGAQIRSELGCQLRKNIKTHSRSIGHLLASLSEELSLHAVILPFVVPALQNSLVLQGMLLFDITLTLLLELLLVDLLIDLFLFGNYLRNVLVEVKSSHKLVERARPLLLNASM
jgi:hypothetical protein